MLRALDRQPSPHDVSHDLSYWSDVLAVLQARSARQLETWWGEAPTIHRGACLDSLPEGAEGILLRTTPESTADSVQRVLAAASDAGIRCAVLEITTLPRLARGDAEPIETRELLRAIHVRTSFRLRRQNVTRARFCRLETLWLIQDDVLASQDWASSASPTASAGFGCRDLYQVPDLLPTRLTG